MGPVGLTETGYFLGGLSRRAGTPLSGDLSYWNPVGKRRSLQWQSHLRFHLIESNKAEIYTSVSCTGGVSNNPRVGGQKWALSD